MHEWVTAQDNYIHAFWQQSHNGLGGQLGIKTEGACAGETSCKILPTCLLGTFKKFLVGQKPPCGGGDAHTHI